MNTDLLRFACHWLSSVIVLTLLLQSQITVIAELKTSILLERHRLENSTYLICSIVIPTTFSTFAEIYVTEYGFTNKYRRLNKRQHC